MTEVRYTEYSTVQTSLFWLSSGQFWFREGMEGDLFGVTSTGEAEKLTSVAGSGTPVPYIQTIKTLCRHLIVIQHNNRTSRTIICI